MPRPWRSGASVLKVPALLVLVAGTCWAVAALVSVWLVPPYLVALGWILFPTAGSTLRPRRVGRDQAVPTNSPVPDPARDQPDGAGGDDPTSRTAASPALEADAGGPGLAPDSSGATTATTAKPKRARSRARKAKPTIEAVEVAPATWIEVGPGKFVRVETPPESVIASANGPHLAVAPEPIAVAEADPTAVEDELSGSSPTVGSALPGLAFLPRLDQEHADHSRAADFSLDGTDAVVGVPARVEAPPEVAAGSLVDPVADLLDARPDPGALDLIAPIVDGTAPQVGVDEEPEPVVGQSVENHATALAHEAGLDLRTWDALAPGVASTAAEVPAESWTGASREGAAVVDPVTEVEPSSQVAAADATSEATCVTGIASKETLEVAPATPDVSGPQATTLRLEIRRARVESSRLTRQRPPRGSRRREGRPDGPSTPTRRLVRRVLGRPRQISRTSKPRSPPAAI